MFNWEALKGCELLQLGRGVISTVFKPWEARKEIDDMEFNDKEFTTWYNKIVEVTKSQFLFPTRIINHYQKWF